MNALVAGLKTLGPVRLAALGAVGIAVMGVIVFLAARAGQPPMALLYGELEQRDAAQIVAALERQRIPYRLSANGTQVLVPTDQVPRVRLSLAAEGLPAGGSVGYEIFDRADGLTASSFQQGINHLRALEGELARTIRSIHGVRAARVHLVLPRRDPFSRRIVIDRGLTHDVQAGQAVIDDVGVIGQVTRVFPLVSEVTLLTDKRQAISVQVARNGLRAVLTGAGSGAMELRYLPANAEVEPGDTLLTSGLDGVYPPGLPVARVMRVERDNAHSFARIECAPLAGVERQGQVLVLGKRVAPPLPEDAPEQPKQSGKGRKASTAR